MYPLKRGKFASQAHVGIPWQQETVDTFKAGNPDAEVHGIAVTMMATLDVLSGGRAMLGVGAGYLEPEFRAVGANFSERGAITDEYLEAMQALWYGEHPEYHGKFVTAQPSTTAEVIALLRVGCAPTAASASKTSYWGSSDP